MKTLKDLTEEFNSEFGGAIAPDAIRKILNAGYYKGLAQGQDIGYIKGNTNGYNIGIDKGYSKGRTDGYDIGLDEGYKKGCFENDNEGFGDASY